MGRLRGDTLDRVDALCDRVLDVVGELERLHVSRRILDQLTGAGTAVGANLFEADEAMSRKDFVKCLAIANKELNETRFWIRLVSSRNWIDEARLAGLLDESDQLKRVIGAIIRNTRSADANVTAI